MLTLRKKRFIDIYKATGNASESAKIAGYSAKTARTIGSKLLTDIDVKTAIDAWRSEEKEKYSKDSIVDTVYKEYETADEKGDRLRGLELTSKLLGYIGQANDSRPNQTLNIVINDTASMSSLDKLAKLRALLDA